MRGDSRVKNTVYGEYHRKIQKICELLVKKQTSLGKSNVLKGKH